MKREFGKVSKMTEGFCLIIAITGLISLILERMRATFMMYLHKKFYKPSLVIAIKPRVVFFTF
jgi:hypothetical protein